MRADGDTPGGFAGDSTGDSAGESRRPVSVEEYEAVARGRLSQMAFDYFVGGAGREWTLRENVSAFDRWVLLPRVLVDVSERDLSTTVLGQPVAFPVLVAPTALHRMAHPDGEPATARAAAGAGTVYTLSSLASTSIEEVVEGASYGAKWFQLYVYRDRDLTAELVKRAHGAGYRALMLTVDTPVLGLRDRDARNRFVAPEGVTLGNLVKLGGMREVEGSGLFAFVYSQQDPSVDWDDVAWLRSLSPLPLLLKGVIAPQDAELAVQAGVDGIVVSNHGGRQLDGTSATIDALPDVVEAVAGRAEVLLDGGVRRGSDVLKALALGARAVMVGRPVLWGLAAEGEAGVRHVLELLRAELDVALAIAGCTSVADVGRALVRRA